MSATSAGDAKEKDPSKFKNYATAIDKALKSFDNPNEWADLISALGKLIKTILSGAKFKEVPKPVTVAKRLSQCLHPALPMGVHVKALEAYKVIFDLLGPEKLPEYLYLYAVGLFPLMDHCGIKVKSELFLIFETYLVPLGPDLRPALPGFLAGVLLGLEEGTEFYNRSITLLDNVCDNVGTQGFFACLWQAALGSPIVRLPAMLYVNAKYAKMKSVDDQTNIVGDHVNHMVAALCITADDVGSPLVQRHLLDFLVAAFPMDSSNLTDEDFIQLLRRCLFVVLRRDMSLNRRLYTWLINQSGQTAGVSSISLGGDDSGLELAFFNRRVLPLIVKAIDEYLDLDIVEVPLAHNSTAIWGERKEYEQMQYVEVRVCRLLLYLQDRADIGRLILDAVFSLFLKKAAHHLKKYQTNLMSSSTSDLETSRTETGLFLPLRSSSSFQSVEPIELPVDGNTYEKRIDELTKTFNMLLNSLEQGFLWDFLGKWYESIVAGIGAKHEQEPELYDFTQVMMLCLKICNVESDSKVREEYLPLLLKRILTGLSNITLLENVQQKDLLLIFDVCTNLQKIVTTNSMSTIQEISVVEAEEEDLSAEPVGHTENKLLEECQEKCVDAMAAIFEIYEHHRTQDYLALIDTACELFNTFLQLPSYQLDEQEDEETPIITKPWLRNILAVIDGVGWLREMRGAKCGDVAARATLLDVLCTICTKSSTLIAQHAEHRQRCASDVDAQLNETITTILLRPLIAQKDLEGLEKRHRVFSQCAEAVWIGVGSKWCTRDQQKLAQLLVKLHSRRAAEPSSDVENIIVHALTSTDDLVCTEAAKTFHRVWVLTRNCTENGTIPYVKPFNRVVKILLGVLADESVSQARTELKAAAFAWFSDCAKHNDLPRIIQMLATMLMNPVTARVSIQYVRQESILTSDTFNSLPEDVNAVTLVTIDGKQRLYHIDGKVNECSPWLGDVRHRLLLSSSEKSIVTETSTLHPGSLAGDVPNFDDDTDSLDTLSLNIDGIDSAVVETLQSIIDQVVEQEEQFEETERRVMNAIGDRNIEPHGLSFTYKSEERRSPEGEPQIQNEVVQRIKKGHKRTDSLQESIFSMTERDLKAFDTTEILRVSQDSSTDGQQTAPLFDELHIHMLLYNDSGRVVDLGQAEMAFRILTALLKPRGGAGNRMLLNCLVTSGTGPPGPSEEPGSSSLTELLARHVRAIFGNHFWTNTATDDDQASKHKHLTLLDSLISISLHYLRSYFLNSPIAPVSDSDLVTSWKCKISALEFLSELISELSAMVNEQESRPFVIFIQSILNRAKLQKCLLHMLFTAVHNEPDGTSKNGKPLALSISAFNEGLLTGAEDRLTPLLAAYHRSLLTLTAQAIRLESNIKNGFHSFSDDGTNSVLSQRLSINHHLYNTASRSSAREPHASLVELRAFLVILLSALKKQPQRHEMWLQFIVQILPWMERSLATIVCRVVEQLCKNVEVAMGAAYNSPITCDVVTDSPDLAIEPDGYPANYLVTTLESLTTLVHFCVLDTTAASATTATTTTSAATTSTIVQPVSTVLSASTSVVGHAISAIPGTKGATELFSNLVKAFTFSDSSSGGAVALSKIDGARQGNSWRQAKLDMLSSFPHSLATICNVWNLVRTQQNPSIPIGTTAQLRRLVIQLLSPIARLHEHEFLAALALVWLTRSNTKLSILRKHDPDRPNFTYSTAQKDIANLMLTLKVVQFDNLITAVIGTLKEASLKASKMGLPIDKANFPTEEPLLELVHACTSIVSPSELRQSWPTLFNLFNEAPLSNLSARAVFLLFVILCDFVKSATGAYIVEEKSMSKNVQDACARLTEAVNVIVGWQLETTTWLKRTLVVKQDHSSSSSIRSVDQSPMTETPSSVVSGMSLNESGSYRNSTLSLIAKPSSLDGSGSLSSDKTDKKSSSNLRASVKDTNNNKRDPAHSTQALFLLAERLTDLLDQVSKSDDKEKVLPILNSVWANVVPYLRAKNARNARFFLASSQLLASMSSYSYMRPVWKKTTLELLLDSTFFKMDHQSLKQWLIVTDHLMTHDRTSFKDLLKSIAYTPNASFSIMSSKEQEYEARAQALKRLAFVVLGSQLDQYHAQMNDIQERLSSDALRVSQSPVVRGAVFLCIRVLLLRLRPQSLVGVWPIMVTELVHVLLQLEQQLNVADRGIEELASARDDQWMQLYLAACKLLESLCTLPSGHLAHFQMCQWAFVTSVSVGNTDRFQPFTTRIHEGLCKKYGEFTANEMESHSASLSGIKILTSFEELRPFFYALATLNKSVPGTKPILREAHYLSGSLSHKLAVQRLENALYVDFSEHLQL